MIKNDFKIDFEKKKIVYIGKGKKIFSVNELYSFLQDIFDEPENMRYEIPMKAITKDKFELINGWTIDEEGLKYINGKIFVRH